MADSSARVTTFTPDCAGVYVAQLVVSDGDLDSKPCAIPNTGIYLTNEDHHGFAGIGNADSRTGRQCIQKRRYAAYAVKQAQRRGIERRSG